MLLSLNIRDFAIIDELELELGAGLNVMTGETGAGKTIIVEALKLVLGSRAEAHLIRAGSDRASVTATFDAEGLPRELLAELSEAGIECDGELIVHRVVGAQSKGKIAVNGVPVTGAMLKRLAEHLIDVSSQHEHQLLLDPAEHAAIVDAFGGLAAECESFRSAHELWSTAYAELEKLIATERETKEKLDFLKFALKELDAANLKPGEDAEIEAERRRLKHAVQLEEKARGAEAALYGDAGSAMEQVDRALSIVSQCAELDPGTEKWRDSLNRARVEIEEAARGLAEYAERLESNPTRLEDLEERFFLIRDLTKKYGGSIEACLVKQKELRAAIDGVENFDERLAEKKERSEALAAARRDAAAKLSAARKKSADKLGKAVAAELAGLGMTKTRFTAAIETRVEAEWDASGADRVEFLFSPNVGEPERPLVRIISGGELSRVMLALKGALAGRARFATTSVFDEVDAGIGGAVAEVVGKKLKDVARSRQVICITHLPQVAVHGDRHIRITKRVEKGRTVTALEALESGARVDEIARMLGGQKMTEATIAHAREMLAQASAL